MGKITLEISQDTRVKQQTEVICCETRNGLARPNTTEPRIIQPTRPTPTPNQRPTHTQTTHHHHPTTIDRFGGPAASQPASQPFIGGADGFCFAVVSLQPFSFSALAHRHTAAQFTCCCICFFSYCIVVVFGWHCSNDRSCGHPLSLTHQTAAGCRPLWLSFLDFQTLDSPTQCSYS